MVVRAAIHIDRRTAQLSVVSDPFPTILKGVPLHIRSVRVSIDKPDFMVTPTNCSAQQVTGTATSRRRPASAPLSTRYQVGNCRNLRFAPRMLDAGGRVGTHRLPPVDAARDDDPAGAGPGEPQSVKVTLPNVLAALLPVVQRACTQAQFEDDRCRQAEIGSVEAVTPLLARPLRGGVFFVDHPGRALPDLVLALRGDVDLDVAGKVVLPHGRQLGTDFAHIPTRRSPR